MKRNKFVFLLILFFIILAAYLRFYNLLGNTLYGDSGYELEKARQINQFKKLPFLGPTLELTEIVIPPTYLYLISFIYFIAGGEIRIISALFALMGFLTVSILSFFIYLLIKNKGIFVLLIAIFSISHYFIYVSRMIWHPHPVLFFLSLSFLSLVLSLKMKKRRYLFLGQFLFFTSLSVYPSPIFVLPIVFYYSYVFFNRIKNHCRIKSFIFVLLSNLIFMLLVYLPLLINIIKVGFSSNPSSILELFRNNLNFSPELIVKNYFSVSKILSQILFSFDFSPQLHLSFILFLAFLLILLIFYRKRLSFLTKIYISPFLYLWVFTILYLLNIVGNQAFHRLDVLFFMFFILLSIGLDLVLNFKVDGSRKIYLLLPFLIFLSIYFYTNIKNSYLSFGYYQGPGSIYAYEKISRLIADEIAKKNLDRSRTMVLNKMDFENNMSSYDLSNSLNYLRQLKHVAQSNDFFINKAKFKGEHSVDNYNLFIRFISDHTHFLENIDYYFLICDFGNYETELIIRQSGACLQEFLFNLKNIDIDNRHLFLTLSSYYFVDQNENYSSEVVFLIKNKVKSNDK